MVKELCVLLTRCEVRTRECGPAVNSSNRAQLGLCDEEFPPPPPHPDMAPSRLVQCQTYCTTDIVCNNPTITS